MGLWRGGGGGYEVLDEVEMENWEGCCSCLSLCLRLSLGNVTARLSTCYSALRFSDGFSRIHALTANGCN